MSLVVLGASLIPANDRLYLKTATETEKINFSIFDLVGKKIVNNAVYSDFIDISMLDGGVYFIQLNDGKNSTSVKFIKIK